MKTVGEMELEERKVQALENISKTLKSINDMLRAIANK